MSRVNPSAAAPPTTTPPAVKARPCDITSRNRSDAPAPSAMRSPSSRVLCETAYDITPYSPIAARSNANPPNNPSILTATRCTAVVRSTCSCIVMSSPGARFASSACNSRTSAFAIASGPCDARIARP